MPSSTNWTAQRTVPSTRSTPSIRPCAPSASRSSGPCRRSRASAPASPTAGHPCARAGASATRSPTARLLPPGAKRISRRSSRRRVADEITLTLPRAPDFHRVAHLVLGGLAVRLHLTIENLQDLELALDSILDRTDPEGGEITIKMCLRDGELETVIGPLTHRLLGELDLRRVLESTVEDVRIDADRVHLTKKVAVRG